MKLKHSIIDTYYNRVFVLHEDNENYLLEYFEDGNLKERRLKSKENTLNGSKDDVISLLDVDFGRLVAVDENSSDYNLFDLTYNAETNVQKAMKKNYKFVGNIMAFSDENGLHAFRVNQRVDNVPLCIYDEKNIDNFDIYSHNVMTNSPYIVLAERKDGRRDLIIPRKYSIGLYNIESFSKYFETMEKENAYIITPNIYNLSKEAKEIENKFGKLNFSFLGFGKRLYLESESGHLLTLLMDYQYDEDVHIEKRIIKGIEPIPENTISSDDTEFLKYENVETIKNRDDINFDILLKNGEFRTYIHGKETNTIIRGRGVIAPQLDYHKEADYLIDGNLGIAVKDKTLIPINNSEILSTLPYRLFYNNLFNSEEKSNYVNKDNLIAYLHFQCK